jgi:hypothetical protein
MGPDLFSLEEEELVASLGVSLQVISVKASATARRAS